MAVNWLGLRQLSELLLPKIREELYGWCREHPQLVGDGYAFSKECVQVLHVDMGFNAFMTTGQIDFSGLA